MAVSRAAYIADVASAVPLHPNVMGKIKQKINSFAEWFFKVSPFIIQCVIWKLFIWIPLYLAFKYFLNLKVYGVENLKDLKQPVIFVPNHISDWDPVLIPAVLPFSSKLTPLFFTSREKEFYGSGVFQKLFYGGFFFRLMGAYPVMVGIKNYEESLRMHIDIVNKKIGSMCIFPEGKISGNENIAQAKGGVAFLVHKTKATVVPVGISGFHDLTLMSVLSRRRFAFIRFGAPIKHRELFVGDKPVEHDEYKKIAGHIMSIVGSLLK